MAKKKASSKIDEKTLTKGQVRKLNALRKSVGEKLADDTFAKWLKKQPGEAKDSTDKNAELIADELGKLIEQKNLRIPRGGYLVTRGRGRVIVTRIKD